MASARAEVTRAAQTTLSEKLRTTAAVRSFVAGQVELFHNAEGKVYCLLEAPDAEAVRKHHEALGVPCGDVHEVSGLL